MKKNISKILGVILILGGIYTFYSSSSQLFGWFGNITQNINYAPAVQVCCFIDAFIYLICGVLFLAKDKLSTPLLFIATVVMFVAYILTLFYINSGRPITITFAGEMLLRTTSTMLFTAVSWYLFSRIKVVLPKGYDEESFKKAIKEYEARKQTGKSNSVKDLRRPEDHFRILH